MERALKNLRIDRREAFKTTAGLGGMRLVTENEQQGRPLRQTFYMFCDGEKAWVVTCSALADGGKTFDSAFEKSMKTFRFEKK